MKILRLGLSPPERRNAHPLGEPLSSPLAWSILTGGHNTDSGESVTPATAAALSCVCACSRYISESVAAIPLRLYEKTTQGKIEAESHPFSRLLGLEPNSESTAISFWSAFLESALLWGSGFAQIQRDGTGTPIALWYLPPTSVSVNRQSDGILMYRVTVGSQVQMLRAEDVLHVPWIVAEDGVTGLSVIGRARGVIGNQIAMEKFGGRFFANNATPSGVLSTKLKVKPEDKIRMRNDWEALQSGRNQHRIAILSEDISYSAISIPNADAQWIEARRFGREDICGLFKLHPSQIGSEARVAGETYSQQSLDFWNTTLRPWLTRVSQEVQRKMLKGLPQYTVGFDFFDLLRTDRKTMAEVCNAAVMSASMTPNESRIAQGMNPGGPECDVFLIQQNMIPLRDLAAKQGTGGTNSDQPV